MIHRLSLNTAYTLLNHQLISVDDLDYATYYFENLYLRINSWVITIVISLITHSFPGVVLFYFFYSRIRMYAGGFHCKTQSGCPLLSVITLLLVVVLKDMTIDIVNVGVLLISSLIVLFIGTVNHTNLALDECELSVCKRKARLFTILELSIIILVIQLRVSSQLIFYMAAGLPINAISMIVSKSIGQEVVNSEGQDERVN